MCVLFGSTLIILVSGENVMDKDRRDELVERYKAAFHKKYGCIPSVRRKKSGCFLFAEGKEEETIISKCFLANEVFFLKHEG